VVTYDRRGFARSPLDAGPGHQVDDAGRLEADVDDAKRLIEKLSDGPAYVFGSSSGAIVGLHLLAGHPGAVRTLVAHEPPLVTLLPDAADHLAFFDEVYDIYRREGWAAAMDRFNTGVGMDRAEMPRLPEGVELPPHIAQMLGRLRANLEYFLEHELRQYPPAVPDLDALRPLTGRLVLAGGRASRGLLPYRPNLVLAERLGLSVVEFPGDHIGYAEEPDAFAARLTEVLTT
jgi:pimeloyl-ACP methyl ester carboxylesterase